MLRIENGGLQFHSQPVLVDIHLRVSRGETFGMIGPGGVGKTVLLKAIAGLLRFNTGTKKILTEKFTMTFQRSGLFDSMTAEENLRFVLSEGRIPAREHRDRIGSALEEVGLASQEALFPHEMSGGMQKRLGIARALLLRPELVLYDDPTAGLDPVTSRTITDLIAAMKEKYKMTVVLATSDLRVAYNLCTHIGFLYQGSFIEVSPTQEFRASTNPIVGQFIRGELEGPIVEDIL